MHDFTFDTLREKYIDQIHKLECVCFDVPWSKNQLRDEISNKLATYFVLICKDVVVGYGGVYCVCFEGNITNIAVSPDFRKMGCASMILKKLIDFAKSQKLQFLTLEVRKSNSAAINLYKKFEFEKAGERKGYYPNGETAVLMTRYFSYN